MPCLASLSTTALKTLTIHKYIDSSRYTNAFIFQQDVLYAITQYGASKDHTSRLGSVLQVKLCVNNYIYSMRNNDTQETIIPTVFL